MDTRKLNSSSSELSVGCCQMEGNPRLRLALFCTLHGRGREGYMYIYIYMYIYAYVYTYIYINTWCRKNHSSYILLKAETHKPLKVLKLHGLCTPLRSYVESDIS